MALDGTSSYGLLSLSTQTLDLADFDAVKISLGELKNIEDGLVVDLTSLYDNNVTLKVEGKPIASGSLVIVNDRYGVKINNVIADSGETPMPRATRAQTEESYEENYEEEVAQEAPVQEQFADSEDDEFDYSDFELEDENI